MSIRAITRLTGVSKTTVSKLVVDAGTAAAWYQDRVFQSLSCKRLQIDEIWGFVGAKQKNVPTMKRPVRCRRRLALDGDRCRDEACPVLACREPRRRRRDEFIDDLASRLVESRANHDRRPEGYLDAIDTAFGGEVDYAHACEALRRLRLEGEHRYTPAECTGAIKDAIQGNPDMAHVSTSYAERNNLNVRMHSRRMTRLTNAFSKKMENHAHAMALHFLYYNFVRIHKTLKTTPAMAAGVTDRLWEVADMVTCWRLGKP